MQIFSGAESSAAAMPVRPRDAAAGALLMRRDRQIDDAGEIGRLDMRQHQAAADAADLRHRLVEARAYRVDLLAARIRRRRWADQRFAVHPECGEGDELGRAVMQVGADAPEIALVDAPRRCAKPSARAGAASSSGQAAPTVRRHVRVSACRWRWIVRLPRKTMPDSSAIVAAATDRDEQPAFEPRRRKGPP